MHPQPDTASKKDLTIVQSSKAYLAFPYEALSTEVVSTLESTPLTSYRTVESLVKILECFLQITNQRVDVGTIERGELAAIFRGFIGALCSPEFVGYTIKRCREVTLAAHSLYISLASQTGCFELPEFDVSTTGLTDFQLSCRTAFRTLEKNEPAIWLWRAWPCTNMRGRKTHLPLFVVFQRLGRSFTSGLHEACRQYYSGRKCQRIIALDDLAHFISNHTDVSEQQLQSPTFMDDFWPEFFLYHIKKGYERGLTVDYLLRNWNNEFVYFAKNYLIDSGLFASPNREFPCSPEGSQSNPKHNHISIGKQGQTVKTKLITHIPLEVTDSEAIEIIFVKLKEDKQIALDWARSAANEMWKRYCRRKESASIGTIRVIGTSNNNTGSRALVARENVSFMNNIAATFEFHGYCTAADARLNLLYGTDLTDAASELGLPTTGSLLAHCTILVATHPIITPSFLETLDLFDGNGQLCGFTTINGEPVLIGRKDRNGPTHALQTIYLTDETKKIVEQIIAVTAPLREYLKSHSDANWRKLLLTSGFAFSYPRPILRLAADTSILSRRKKIAGEISKISKITLEAACDYMERFSLPSLRAQAGVLIYIETKDSAKMAEALGHVEYSPKLLSRYLPDVILSFFQERWIRIFQAGIVVTALKDSKHLLLASGFTTTSELDTFLKNHAFSLLPSANVEESATKKYDSELLFSINSEVLNIFLSLRTRVLNSSEKMTKEAKYWSEIGGHLISHLESSDCKRNDLKAHLTRAKAMQPFQFSDSVIYA